MYKSNRLTVTSKGAIIALNRPLARTLALKIQCNAVSPELAETPMIHNMTDALRTSMTKRFPFCRPSPKGIENPGIFLISDKTSFITRKVIHANGGSIFN